MSARGANSRSGGAQGTLASLKGLAVEEAGDASRRTQVLPCWFLPETFCKTALLPGRVVVHALVFCVQLKTQIRLTDVLSMHHSRRLTKMLSIRPRAFQTEHPRFEKIFTMSALQLAFRT